MPSIGDVKAHRLKYYDTSKIAIADMAFKNVFYIPCCDLTTPGVPGSLQRLNGDLDVLAVVSELSYLIDEENKCNIADTRDEITSRVESLYELMCHCPCTFKKFEDAPGMDRAHFAESFNICEEFKIGADEYGQSAWETACSYNKVRQDNARATGDSSSAGVHRFMSQNCKFSAASSEYACRESDKHTKGADNTLLVFDKLSKSNCARILTDAKSAHGPKSPLTQMSKLVLVCQKCGSDTSKIFWVVNFLDYRMRAGVLSNTTSLSELKAKLLPVALTIYDMQLALCSYLKYDVSESDATPNLDHIWVTSSAANPNWLEYAQSACNPQLGSMLDLCESAKLAIKWCASLVSGEEDSLLKEIAENCKAATAEQKLTYQKVGDVKDRVLKQFAIDITRMTPGETAGSEEQPGANVAGEGDAERMKRATEAELRDRELIMLKTAKAAAEPKDKETAIKEYIDKYATGIVAEWFSWMVRPLTRPNWVDAFKNNHFITTRKEEVLWIFDPDGDKEPIPGDRNSITNTSTLVDMTFAENFVVAFESVVDDQPLARDFLLLSDGQHFRNLSQVLKLVKGCKDEFPLVVTYKEGSVVDNASKGAVRSGRDIVENMCYCSLRNMPTNHAHRLHYNLTTCASNAIIQVDRLPADDLPQVRKDVKVLIHGLSNLPRTERAFPDNALIPLHSHCKNKMIFKELCHTASAKRVVTPTPQPIMLKALVDHGVKTLVIYKNDAHYDFLFKYIKRHIAMEATTNVRCPYYISRAKIISKPGLEPDGLGVQVSTGSDSEADMALDHVNPVLAFEPGVEPPKSGQPVASQPASSEVMSVGAVDSYADSEVPAAVPEVPPELIQDRDQLDIDTVPVVDTKVTN